MSRRQSRLDWELRRRGLVVRILLGLIAALVLAAAPALAQDNDAAATNAAQPDYSWVDQLPRQSGVVPLQSANVQLDLGGKYDFIGPDGAKRIVTEVWGNPPDAADGVLGLILPHGGDPREVDTWGAIVTYLDIGYVSDKDAATTDYGKILDDMRQGEEEDNKEREAQHLDTVHLVGWAQPPSYNAQQHELIWARDLASSKGLHTLNFDIRLLGRRGVLSLNVLAPMSGLPAIQAAASSIGETAQFQPGARYADYDQGDKTAGYGIAGLIAAGAGAVAVKKLGLLGLILAFGKKAFILIAAGFAALAAWFRRTFAGLFGRKAPPATSAAVPPPTATPPTVDGGGPGGGDIVS
jgi:uncharacterized membrane-anchored protein